MLWIVEDDAGQLEVIPTSPPEIQDTLSGLADDVVYTASMQFTPWASTKLFRQWDSAVTPSVLRIHRVDEQPFDRDQIVAMIMQHANDALQHATPPEEYIDMLEFGLLESLETGKRVVSHRYPKNIALDAATLVWILGGVILDFVFLAFLVRKFSPDLEGRCNSCRYDLAGLTSDRCPECGTQIQESP